MTRFSAFFNALWMVLILNSCNNGGKIRWISSSERFQWIRQESPEFSEIPGTTNVITVQENQPQQIISGFGGCFNEMGWDALSVLDSAARDSVIGLFFGPSSELKFSLGRMPVGANDYAMNWYSLDDSAGDFGMKYFSIERDRQRLIPYIKLALAHDPGLKIWASPWCPPAWMKTNKHYACRMSEYNDLGNKDLEGREGITGFIMQPEYLNAYALYFAKFIRAYRNEGIPVYAVHVQNEPNSCQDFPSCIWKSSDLGIFIGKYLGPRLAADVPDAEIWYGTIERPSIRNIDTVMEDPVARKYIAGLGFQWAGKDAIGPAHDEYPDISLMQTESECGDGSNDWKAAEHTFGLIRHYFENGANAYMYWNMILDQTGKSQWGWKQNSLVSINRDTKKVTLNPEYYLFMHITQFVMPGARWLETQGSRKDILAFKNPDNRVVVVIFNPKSTEDNIVISTPSGNFGADLGPESFNTFIYRNKSDL